MLKTPNILLFMPTSRRFERALTRGISQYARLHGPWTFHKPPVFYLSKSRGLNTKKLLDSIIELEINGIFTREVPQIESILELGLPTVVAPYTKKGCLVTEGSPNAISILSDLYSEGRVAAEHLLERGFKNFAYCGFDEFFWSHKRGKGFADRLAQDGFETHFFRQKKSKASRIWMKERFGMAEWLKSLPKPVGLMTCIDERGEHVIDACKLAGLYIPEQVSVIGVDNDDLICEITNPPLTSIALNDEMAGYKASELLDRLMKGKNIKNHVINVYPTHIVTRQSTETFAVNDSDIIEAVQFIRNHAKENIGVNDVSDHVAIPRRMLQRKFRSILGRTVFDQIMYVRIELACRMLLETNTSISQIALQLGFTDTTHISRWFKQIKGETPLVFRKRYSHNK